MGWACEQPTTEMYRIWLDDDSQPMPALKWRHGQRGMWEDPATRPKERKPKVPKPVWSNMRVTPNAAYSLLNGRGPRFHRVVYRHTELSIDRLASSIFHEGPKEPLVLDSDGHLVDGVARLQAVLRLNQAFDFPILIVPKRLPGGGWKTFDPHIEDGDLVLHRKEEA
jgi:hypothetical protein